MSARVQVGARWFLALGLIGAAISAIGWGLSNASPRRRVLRPAVDLSSRPRFPADPYIGSKSCGECHPGEAAAHARSGHARTLWTAADHPVARSLDGTTTVDPERPAVRWSYRLEDGEFWAERRVGDQVEEHLLEYAFGSGHHATTFLSLLDREKLTAMEHRLSWVGPESRLDVTPGQQAGPRQMPNTGSRGRRLTPKITLQCFSCHATQMSAVPGKALDEATLLPNVSCERCHGPARAHVEAARRGETDLKMPFGLDEYTPAAELRMCGDCHRHPDDYVPGSLHPDNQQLARFQPVGLMMSRCYRESGGALSCNTCHDPHGRPSRDTAGYEAKCLDCHGQPHQTACPKSPRAGCIACHMPLVELQRVKFADHWIRVR